VFTAVAAVAAVLSLQLVPSKPQMTGAPHAHWPDQSGLNIDVVATTTPATVALVDTSVGPELLVLGSRGRGGFRGLVVGSVSMQCVLHARCPVAVVRATYHTEQPPGEDGHPAGGIDDARREAGATFL
jgi:hypothetical protein